MDNGSTKKDQRKLIVGRARPSSWLKDFTRLETSIERLDWLLDSVYLEKLS